MGAHRYAGCDHRPRGLGPRRPERDGGRVPPGIPGKTAVLEDLWLEPEVIGRGHGRRLWEHAASVARAGGATAMELDAEPNALGFYERMGAVRVGVTPSQTFPGRELPRLRLPLRE
jgi:ribosomal protein S18 acetylase RimI-like enzyme